jgi:hypothetical protein
MPVLICLLKITNIHLGEVPSLGKHQCVPRVQSQIPGYLIPVDNKIF